jgi:hypothetical protein
MPPKRCLETPLANHVVEREMRELCSRLEAMDAVHRRAPNVGDISDVESEEIDVEEATGENVVKELLLREVAKLGAREKIDIPMYEGNLDVK